MVKVLILQIWHHVVKHDFITSRHHMHAIKCQFLFQIARLIGKTIVQIGELLRLIEVGASRKLFLL